MKIKIPRILPLVVLPSFGRRSVVDGMSPIVYCSKRWSRVVRQAKPPEKRRFLAV
jgi:hypothetical protein